MKYRYFMLPFIIIFLMILVIDYNSETTIVFPVQIEKVASSFVQGFFADIIKKIGYAGLERQIKIVAGTPELVNSIKKIIY